jgi:uncharacterized protein
MTSVPQPGERHLSMDVTRGVAVLGILAMNIVGMGMPMWAYIDPSFYGGSTGANLWAWATSYVLVDGKMRALFTLLFGAGVLLIAQREAAAGGKPANAHYARMFWLMLFGVANAWFLWIGDILFLYAVAGCIAFLFWKRSERFLTAAAVVIVGALAVSGWVEAWHLSQLRAAAEAAGATEAARAAWETAASHLAPPPESIERDLAAMRGGFGDATAVRVEYALMFQTTYLLRYSVWEALALSLLGMALFKSGFFTLGWSKEAYRRMALIGLGVGLPLTVPLAWIQAVHEWDPIYWMATDYTGELIRPFVALGYASLVMLALMAGAKGFLIERLEAAGKAALTNYLGAGLVTSLIFCGYGFGLFGQLERWQLYGVVLLVWAIQLAWSKPWLERFRYGPVEWVWRSLVKGKPQPMRLAAPEA